MAIQRIEEGVSGQQAANTIYENDVFVKTIADDALGKINSVMLTEDLTAGFLTGAGYNRTTGVLTAAATAFSYTSKIDIHPSDSIIYNGSVNGGTVAGVVYFDAQGLFISSEFPGVGGSTRVVYTDRRLAIPPNARYAGFSGFTAEFWSVKRISVAGMASKAFHGYTAGETVKTLKEVEEEIESIFTDSSGNLIYKNGVWIDETRYLNSAGQLIPTNGSYGVMIGVPVELGLTYCVQGLGSDTVIRVAGVGASGVPIGNLPVVNQGDTFDYWATFTIPAGVASLNIMFLLPSDERAFQVKQATAPSEVTSKTILPRYLPPANTQSETVLYVDPVSGNDANSGTSAASALKTLTQFRLNALGSLNTTLNMAQGVYLEPLNLSGLSGDVRIIAQEGAEVIISGATEITGWTAEAGYTGIYKAPFSATIPVHGGHNQGRGVLFEDGRPSGTISQAERHSAQKGLSHRLPFTPIQQNLTATLTDLDANGGWFVEGGFIYMKTTDGTSPASNGFNYKYIARSTYTGSAAIRNLYLRGISFRFTTSVRFAAQFMERYNCSILACTGDGFVNNTNKLRSWFDECAYCGNDGANGHYNGRANWTTLGLRVSGNSAEYYYGWFHDNMDDGLSHHEASHLFILGGLFEYNGDGGVRPSNTCNGEIHNAYARKNGQDPTGGSVKGSGFDIVNTALAGDVRLGNTIILYNCVSEENTRGYASINDTGRLTLVGCIAKNNTYADYNAEGGVIIAKNCKALNSDPLKVKVITGTGSIESETYADI